MIETHDGPVHLACLRDMGISPRNLWLPRPPAGTISAGLVVLLALSSFAVAQEREAVAPAPEEIARPLARAHSAFTMVGTNTCSSVACHGSQQAELGRPRVREAYLNWMEFDPHARTRELLYSDKYAAILGRLEKGGHERTAMASRCAKCHDPSALPGDIAGTATYSGSGEGVGCESCHGNAEKWLTRHYEFGVTPQELLSLGKINTKSLPQRAAACAKCHVGSPDHDMNHDMIAAGHPPLRFEQAAYEDLIKFKHWNDGPARLEKQDYQVQLWAAGQTASAKARLDLLSARAQQLIPEADDAPKPEKKQIWTEFAEFSCFSCHQKILPDPVVETTTKGSPVWSRWNLTFAGQLQANDSKLRASLLDLSSQRMSVDPAKLISLSDAAHRALSATQSNVPLDRHRILQLVITSLKSPESDWETRSQQYLALAAIVRAQHDELAKAEFLRRIGPNHSARRLQIYDLSQKLNQLGEDLRFERSTGEMPANGVVLIDAPIRFHDNREKLGAALLNLAEQLHDQIKP